jgi:hypothetical protein
MTSERLRSWTRSLLATYAAATFVVTGCGERPPAPSMSPTASAPASQVPAAQLDAWVLFRKVYGLRADPAWALAVSEDPRAVGAELGVPLLPAELELVAAANSSAQRLAATARTYGNRFLKDFAGSWIEGPLVVLAFTDDVELHQSEATALFGQRVVVRPARYSRAELNAFVEAVNDQRDWFLTIGAELHGTDVNEPTNSVDVHYLGPDQTVETLIRARFAESDWLHSVYDGPLPWTGPVGDLALTVVDPKGRPVSVECLLYTLDPRVRHEDIRNFRDGKCVFPSIPAVEWLVDVTFDAAGQNKTVTKKLVVPADGIVRSTLTVSP